MFQNFYFLFSSEIITAIKCKAICHLISHRRAKLETRLATMVSFAVQLVRTMKCCTLSTGCCAILLVNQIELAYALKHRNSFYQTWYSLLEHTIWSKALHKTSYIPFFEPETTRLRKITETTSRIHSTSKPCAAIMAKGLPSAHSVSLVCSKMVWV